MYDTILIIKLALFVQNKLIQVTVIVALSLDTRKDSYYY